MQPEVVPAATQVAGLRQALDRLVEAGHQQDDPTKTYIPLFEALNWLVALSERFGADWTPDGERLKKDWPKRARHSDVILGLLWVRNVVHHQWADALRLDPAGHPLHPSDGLYPSEDLYPGLEHAWVWRPAQELPSRRRDKAKRAAYVGHLEGRAAVETLRAGLESCELVALLIEPPRPGRLPLEGDAAQ